MFNIKHSKNTEQGKLKKKMKKISLDKAKENVSD